MANAGANDPAVATGDRRVSARVRVGDGTAFILLEAIAAALIFGRRMIPSCSSRYLADEFVDDLLFRQIAAGLHSELATAALSAASIRQQRFPPAPESALRPRLAVDAQSLSFDYRDRGECSPGAACRHPDCTRIGAHWWTPQFSVLLHTLCADRMDGGLQRNRRRQRGHPCSPTRFCFRLSYPG